MDGYLAQVERALCGSRSARGRLLAELRAHVEDSLAAGHAPDEAIARLGTADDVAAAWRAHTVARRSDDRRRGAVLALAVATTAALGIAQHASGHRPPAPHCPHAQSSASGSCRR
ncbi:MAG: HAAS signaling domain-containing protein [Gaiellaceae bacterium]